MTQQPQECHLYQLFPPTLPSSPSSPSTLSPVDSPIPLTSPSSGRMRVASVQTLMESSFLHAGLKLVEVTRSSMLFGSPKLKIKKNQSKRQNLSLIQPGSVLPVTAHASIWKRLQNVWRHHAHSQSGHHRPAGWQWGQFFRFHIYFLFSFIICVLMFLYLQPWDSAASVRLWLSGSVTSVMKMWTSLQVILNSIARPVTHR